ncbi:MAG: S24 family peptidase [Alphaproteobacteria bacterium]
MSIGKRVKERLSEISMSEYAAAKMLGIHYSNIQGLTSGRVKKPRYLGELAEVLRVHEKWLRTGEGSKELAITAATPSDMLTNPHKDTSNLGEAFQQPFAATNTQRNLPVYGTAAAGEETGAFQISMGSPIDYIHRPYHLIHNQDSFAIYVQGSSMEPKFEGGDLVFIDPHKSPKPYDYVIIELIDNIGEREVFIKRYLGQKDGEIVCLQYNPYKKRTYPLERVVKLHRVFTNNEIYGA